MLLIDKLKAGSLLLTDMAALAESPLMVEAFTDNAATQSVAARELERLYGGLPRTKDGMPMVPGSRICRVRNGIIDENVVVKAIDIDGSMSIEIDGDVDDVYFDDEDDDGAFDLYSSRGAAEADLNQTPAE